MDAERSQQASTTRMEFRNAQSRKSLTFSQSFYEELFDSRTKVDFDLSLDPGVDASAPKIDENEVHAELLKMVKNKAPDRVGIVAEMIQQGGATLRALIADVFTDILTGATEASGACRMSFITVLFEKGNPRLPDNYRLITMLSILFKLLSRMLLSRIRVTLEQE